MLDLFCGAGGFPEGFRSVDCQIVGGVDHWKPAVDTFNCNFGLEREPAEILFYEKNVLLIEARPPGRPQFLRTRMPGPTKRARGSLQTAPSICRNTDGPCKLGRIAWMPCGRITRWLSSRSLCHLLESHGDSHNEHTFDFSPVKVAKVSVIAGNQRVRPRECCGGQNRSILLR